MTRKRVLALLPLCVNGVPAREERLNELPKMTHPGTGRAGIQIQFYDTTMTGASRIKLFWPLSPSLLLSDLNTADLERQGCELCGSTYKWTYQYSTVILLSL